MSESTSSDFSISSVQIQNYDVYQGRGVKKFIKVRTEFEGFHYYPGAGEIDDRIKFLESEHRHIFKVEVKISVNHSDRELEFFLVKWALQDFISGGNMDHKSCEMIAEDIIYKHLFKEYGQDRHYEVVVSEDGESDGIVVYDPGIKIPRF